MFIVDARLPFEKRFDFIKFGHSSLPFDEL